MLFFSWLQRFRQSRGYGVHSPFAFELIRKVLSSHTHYYAFDEITDHLTANHPDVRLNLPLHHLSFRLVHHFKAKKILEIHSGYGANTLYLLAPDKDIRCTCVEERPDRIAIARQLTAERSSQCVMHNQLPGEGLFDAIFIHLGAASPPSLDSLIHLSHERTFWVIDQVNTPGSKQFWRNIVNDERTGITFDMKERGVVFLRHTYSKLHYYI